MQRAVSTISDDHILSLLQKEATYEEGFKLLVEKYQERLYWHIRRLVTEHDDANDVIQNSLIKIYRNIDKFEHKSKLYTWLYRIATNESLSFLKQKKRKATNSIDDESLGLNRPLTADAYVDGDDIQRKLKAAINTLPEKQRIVFNMRYYDALSYQDISDILSTSIGALKASYHHAAKKIEQHLRAHSEENQ